MSEHPVEALQEFLDDRLAAAERAALEGHLKTCERCQRELELLRWTRRALRGAAKEPLPEATRLEVLAALDREDAAATPRQKVGRPWLLAAAGLAASLLLAAGLFWSRVAPPELPLAVARDFVEYRGGALELERVTEDVAVIQDFFTDRGLGFDARVFDLAMMGLPPCWRKGPQPRGGEERAVRLRPRGRPPRHLPDASRRRERTARRCYAAGARRYRVLRLRARGGNRGLLAGGKRDLRVGVRYPRRGSGPARLRQGDEGCGGGRLGVEPADRPWSERDSNRESVTSIHSLFTRF